MRQWLELAESYDLVSRVNDVDWNLEIGAITDLNAKQKKRVLLFDNVKGYQRGFRLITGALLDAPRVAAALGLAPEVNDMDLVQILKQKMSDAGRKLGDYSPKYVKSAPLLENSMEGDKVDLFKFPAPKWYENDGGRYLGTMDLVVTHDPTSSWVNVGTYRAMIHDKNTLGILMEAPRHGRVHMRKYFDQNKPCPVAISFGHHPCLSLFAGMDLPQGISEYDYSGSITGERHDVIEGSLTSLPIPADSEVAAEGYIMNDLRNEGPLGEFMGYYGSGVMKNPIIKVERIYYRNNPIILGTCAGKPPYDYSYFRAPIRSALIWDMLDKTGIPNVRGVWCHEAGYTRAFTVVSVEQTYAGHARQAGYVACQIRPGAGSGRYVVVVDEDIDPSNLGEVIWAICSRSDPATCIDIIRDSLGTPLDPIAGHSVGKNLLEYTSSRGIILGCKPFEKVVRGEFPRVVEASHETYESVKNKWPDLFS